jgi:hypothetical protein
MQRQLVVAATAKMARMKRPQGKASRDEALTIRHSDPPFEEDRTELPGPRLVSQGIGIGCPESGDDFFGAGVRRPCYAWPAWESCSHQVMAMDPQVHPRTKRTSASRACLKRESTAHSRSAC